MGPRPRSAHCLLSRPPDLLTFGGDTGIACQRLNDLWLLRSDAARPNSGAWECIATDGPEPEPRSNCAAAVAANKLFVFGGWDAAGVTPLAALGILDLNALQWSSLDEVAGEAPSPRGQPTMVATTGEQSLLVFGGWDGKRRYNDMHSLDVNSLTWSPVTPASDVVPPARADHSSCMWRYCDDGVWKDLLVTFGGCTDTGVQSDVWLYDLRWQLWTEAFCAGEAPPKRSSHAAAVIDDVLLVIGGQNGGHVFTDAYLLYLDSLTWQQVNLEGFPGLCRHSVALCQGALWVTGGFNGEQTLDTVFRLPLQGLVPPAKKGLPPDPDKQQELREGALAAKSGLVAGLKAAAAALLSRPQAASTTCQEGGTGGGKATVSSTVGGGTLDSAEEDWFGVMELHAAVVGTPSNAAQLSHREADAAGGGQDESLPAWPEKQEPYSVHDLDPVDRQLTGWKLTRKLHAAAVAAGRDQYIDPPSGYTVFTARYLGRRPCCGNKCRHCPWAHANVKKEEDW